MHREILPRGGGGVVGGGGGDSNKRKTKSLLKNIPPQYPEVEHSCNSSPSMFHQEFWESPRV